MGEAAKPARLLHNVNDAAARGAPQRWCVTAKWEGEDSNARHSMCGTRLCADKGALARLPGPHAVRACQHGAATRPRRDDGVRPSAAQCGTEERQGTARCRLVRPQSVGRHAGVPMHAPRKGGWLGGCRRPADRWCPSGACVDATGAVASWRWQRRVHERRCDHNPAQAHKLWIAAGAKSATASAAPHSSTHHV